MSTAGLCGILFGANNAGRTVPPSALCLSKGGSGVLHASFGKLRSITIGSVSSVLVSSLIFAFLEVPSVALWPSSTRRSMRSLSPCGDVLSGTEPFTSTGMLIGIFVGFLPSVRSCGAMQYGPIGTLGSSTSGLTSIGIKY